MNQPDVIGYVVVLRVDSHWCLVSLRDKDQTGLIQLEAKHPEVGMHRLLSR